VIGVVRCWSDVGVGVVTEGEVVCVLVLVVVWEVSTRSGNSGVSGLVGDGGPKIVSLVHLGK
jgi:hypothetical protein